MSKKIYLILISLVYLIILSSFTFGTSHLKIDSKIYQLLDNSSSILIQIKIKENPNLLKEKIQFNKGKSIKSTPFYQDKISKQTSISNILAGIGSKILYESEYGNGILVKITKDQLLTLITNDYIEELTLPLSGSTFTSESSKIINADDVWNLGYTGKNQTVCIIDSGIDTDHPSFNGKILDEKCFCNMGGGCCIGGTTTSDTAEDDSGHGTLISGIIVGNSTLVKGIAPSAKIVAVKVTDSNGKFLSTVEIGDAIDWCTDVKDNHSISVISMSLGTNTLFDNPSDCTMEDDVISGAYNNNISLIAASGNAASSTGIAWPACHSKLISVGATTKTDTMHSNTNRNNLLDLVAPGKDIITTGLGGSNTSVCTGTSCAAPHVSGAAALLQDAYNGKLTPQQIKTALKMTGKQVWDPFTARFYPRIDVLEAYNALPFIDTYNITDWPFFHHDSRRTGYSFLKGDMVNSTTQSILSFAGTPATDFWDDPAIANVRNDLSGSEIIVSTQNYDYTDGRVYMLNGSGSQKWSFTDGQPIFAPSIDDIDGDGTKEVIVAAGSEIGDNWKIYALNGESGTQHWASPISLPTKSNQLGARHTAIDDLNHDGDKEIVYSEVGSSNSFTAYVYAVNHDKSVFWNSSANPGQGFQVPMAIANIEGDEDEDVMIANFCEVIAFDGENGSRVWTRPIGITYSGPAVADLNGDGEYEVVVGGVEL